MPSVVVPSNGTEGEAYIPVASALTMVKLRFRVYGSCDKDYDHTSQPQECRHV